MQFSSTFVGLVAVAAAAVQAQAPPAVTASASTPLKVTVGANGKFEFVPSNIIAPVGSQIEFSFYPKNHTVTQSSFKDPCHPLSTGGFFSGFVPTMNSPSGTTFTFTVQSLTPVWFYCSQTVGSHCQAGMVGSINASPTGSNTLEAFIGLAKNATNSTFPAGGPAGGVLAVSNASSSAGSSSGSSSTASSSTLASSSAISTSAIVSTYTSASSTYTTTLGSSTIFTVSSTTTVAQSSSGTSSSATSSGSSQPTGNSAVSNNANLLGVAAVVFGAMAMA